MVSSVNIEMLEPELSDVNITRERIDKPNISCVLSNSFGFGGTNGSLCIVPYDEN